MIRRWQELEPVRLYLYGVTLAGIALAVALSLLTAEEALAWGAFGAAVLGVPAVEAARSRVTPVAREDVLSAHEEARPAWVEGTHLDVLDDTPPRPASGPPPGYVD